MNGAINQLAKKQSALSKSKGIGAAHDKAMAANMRAVKDQMATLGDVFAGMNHSLKDANLALKKGGVVILI